MKNKTRICLCFLLVLILSSSFVYSSALTNEYGSIKTKLNNYYNKILSRDSEMYVVPSLSEKEILASAFNHLTKGNLTEAVSEAYSVNYIIVNFTDFSGEKYYILEENNSNNRGWGWYIVKSSSSLNGLIIQIAHPKADMYTFEIGIDAFLNISNKYLFIAGAHRYANSDNSSDVAHNNNTVFFKITERIADNNVELFQPHGFSLSNRPGYPNFIIADGLLTNKSVHRKLGNNLINKGFTVGYASKNNYRDLAATTNVLGQFINKNNGTFIHVEADNIVRFDSELRNKYVQALKQTWYSCYQNSDCGTNGWVNSPVCSNEDVWQNYRTYTCNNPETVNASCSNSTNLTLKQDCGEDYCGNLSANYCKLGNVYYNRTCYDRGCSAGSCFNNSFTDEQKVQNCQFGCSSGSCNPVPLIHDIALVNFTNAINRIKIEQNGSVILSDPAQLNCNQSFVVKYRAKNKGNFSETITATGKIGSFVWQQALFNLSIGETSTDRTKTVSQSFAPGFYNILINASIVGFSDNNPADNSVQRQIQIICSACFINSDCGNDGFIGSLSCSNDDVWQTWRGNFTCNNPGTSQAFCNYTDALTLKKDCGNDYCLNFGANYCKNNDVYHNRTCYDLGCSSGACFNRSFVNETKVQDCAVGCENGNCKTGVWLIAPEYGKEFSRLNPETFEWNSSSEFAKFKVQISQTPDFKKKKSLGKTIKYVYGYKASDKDWDKLIKLDEKDIDGVLYWRVYGTGNGVKAYSNVHSFSLA